MGKRIIIIAIIILGLAVPAWYIYVTLKAPSQIKLILPQESKSNIDTNSLIQISIDSNDNLYINEIQTDFNTIDLKIDSLAELGYNDSVLTLLADSKAKVQTTIKIMKYAKGVNRKLILKTNK